MSEQFGELWERETMRLTKKELVEMVKRQGAVIIDAENKDTAQRAAAIAHLRSIGKRWFIHPTRGAKIETPEELRAEMAGALAAYRAVGILLERKP